MLSLDSVKVVSSHCPQRIARWKCCCRVVDRGEASPLLRALLAEALRERATLALAGEPTRARVRGALRDLNRSVVELEALTGHFPGVRGYRFEQVRVRLVRAGVSEPETPAREDQRRRLADLQRARQALGQLVSQQGGQGVARDNLAQLSEQMAETARNLKSEI